MRIKIINPNTHISHGFHAACLAHLANISYRVGKKAAPGEVKERLQGDKWASATFENFAQNLADNQIDIAVNQVVLGPWLSLNTDTLKFEGEFAEEANKIDPSWLLDSICKQAKAHYAELEGARPEMRAWFAAWNKRAEWRPPVGM